MLAACAGRPTLEELENDAVNSGEWDAVQRREALLERRRAASPDCPNGFVNYCWDHLAEERCACVKSHELFRYAGL